MHADTQTMLTNAWMIMHCNYKHQHNSFHGRIRTFSMAHILKVVYVVADKGGIKTDAHAPLQKQTWTLKSDIISRVIYLQLTALPLLEKQQTDVSLVLMKKTTNRRWGSIVWGEVLYDDIMHRTVHASCLCKSVYTLSSEHYLWNLAFLWFMERTCGVKITIGCLINKNKSVYYYSSPISLLADNSNSLQHLPLTFSTQINLVATPQGELSVRATNLHDA